MAQVKLLDNVSTDSSTADADGFDPKGARFNVQTDGTIGGASITLYASLDGGTTRRELTYEDGSTAVITTNGIIEVDRLVQGYLVYAGLVGGSPSGVTVTCIQG